MFYIQVYFGQEKMKQFHVADRVIMRHPAYPCLSFNFLWKLEHPSFKDTYITNEDDILIFKHIFESCNLYKGLLDRILIARF